MSVRYPTSNLSYEDQAARLRQSLGITQPTLAEKVASGVGDYFGVGPRVGGARPLARAADWALEQAREAVNAPVYGPITAGDIAAGTAGLALGGPAGAAAAIGLEQRAKMALGGYHAIREAAQGNTGAASQTAVGEVLLPYLGGKIIPAGMRAAGNFVRGVPSAISNITSGAYNALREGATAAGSRVVEAAGELGSRVASGAAELGGQAAAAAGRVAPAAGATAAGAAAAAAADAALRTEETAAAKAAAEAAAAAERPSFTNTTPTAPSAASEVSGYVPTDAYGRPVAAPTVDAPQIGAPGASFTFDDGDRPTNVPMDAWERYKSQLDAFPYRHSDSGSFWTAGIQDYSTPVFGQSPSIASGYGLTGGGAGAGSLTMGGVSQIAAGRHLTVDERQRRRRF